MSDEKKVGHREVVSPKKPGVLSSLTKRGGDDIIDTSVKRVSIFGRVSGSTNNGHHYVRRDDSALSLVEQKENLDNSKLRQIDTIKSLLEGQNFSVPMALTPHQPIEGIGPCSPDFFSSFENRRREAEAHLIRHLEGLSREQLDELSKSSLKQIRLSWDLRLENEPNWYAGGFNVAGREVDFPDWARMEYWSDNEACCLSIGFEPQDVDVVSRPPGSPGLFFHNRHETIQRSSASEEPTGLHRPTDFCAWALENDIEVHAGLSNAVAAHTKSKNLSEVAVLEFGADKQRGRETKSMASLILAMAIDAYGYDPTVASNPVPKEIQDIADRLGLKISQNTIREYLRLGAEMLPKVSGPN